MRGARLRQIDYNSYSCRSIDLLPFFILVWLLNSCSRRLHENEKYLNEAMLLIPTLRAREGHLLASVLFFADPGLTSILARTVKSCKRRQDLTL